MEPVQHGERPAPHLPASDPAASAESREGAPGTPAQVAPAASGLVLWRSLSLLLLGGLLVAGLASAGQPRTFAAPLVVRAQATCDERQVALPPGHPPVPGYQGWQGRLRASPDLPPGHPPIHGRASRAGQARPLAPVFDAPGLLDI